MWAAVGLGHSGGPSERGVAVLGVSEAAVFALGRAFGQLAVVHGRLGEAVRLVVDSDHAMSDHAPLDIRLDALHEDGATDALRRFAADAALAVQVPRPHTQEMRNRRCLGRVKKKEQNGLS